MSVALWNHGLLVDNSHIPGLCRITEKSGQVTRTPQFFQIRACAKLAPEEPSGWRVWGKAHTAAIRSHPKRHL